MQVLIYYANGLQVCVHETGKKIPKKMAKKKKKIFKQNFVLRKKNDQFQNKIMPFLTKY